MRTRIVVALAVFAGVLLAAGQAMAREKGAEPKKPKKATVVGTVAVTKENDAAGAEVIKSITISTPKASCSVVLDENGKKVAELDGKKVKAVGTMEEKDGTKWLTVESCEQPPAKKKKTE